MTLEHPVVMDPSLRILCQFWRSSTNNWLAFLHRMSTTTMQFARRRHAEFARTRCNCGPTGTPKTFKPHLETSNVGSPLHTTASGWFTRTLAFKIFVLPWCLSAPTNASKTTSTPPRPAQTMQMSSEKALNRSPSKSETCTVTIARCCLRLTTSALKGLLVHFLLGTRAEHPRPHPLMYVKGLS